MMNARQRRKVMRQRAMSNDEWGWQAPGTGSVWTDETPKTTFIPRTKHESDIARAFLIGTAIGTSLIGALVVLAIIVGHC
jgi:hypothetical protein